MDLKKFIRTVPNFPKTGIMFRDITTLLQSPIGFKHACDALYKRYKDKKVDVIVGIESRGFVFGSILAYKLGLPLVLVRKPGKLPYKLIKQEYKLEYGTDTIEMHEDSVKKGNKVLIIDDLIATAGTSLATADLIKKLGGEIVECAFVIELVDLKGREKLTKQGHEVFSLVSFEGE